jgi:hypothetical protein
MPVLNLDYYSSPWFKFATRLAMEIWTGEDAVWESHSFALWDKN